MIPANASARKGPEGKYPLHYLVWHNRHRELEKEVRAGQVGAPSGRRGDPTAGHARRVWGGGAARAVPPPWRVCRASLFPAAAFVLVDRVRVMGAAPARSARAGTGEGGARAWDPPGLGSGTRRPSSAEAEGSGGGCRLGAVLHVVGESTEQPSGDTSRASVRRWARPASGGGHRSGIRDQAVTLAGIPAPPSALYPRAERCICLLGLDPQTPAPSALGSEERDPPRPPLGPPRGPCPGAERSSPALWCWGLAPGRRGSQGPLAAGRI